MADKEFTQICKEILGIGKRLEKIEPEELRKIKTDIERISEAVAADKTLFDTDKKDFDGKYNKIAEIIKTFDTLKAQIEEVLKSGTINDSAEALISTFSSKKIMDLLNEVKGVVDEKFNTIYKNGISPWNSSLDYPAGAISVLNNKLYQAKSENTNKNPSSNKETWRVIASEEWCEQTFLNKDDKIDAYNKTESDEKFALKDDLPELATETKTGITKLKNIINAKQTDTAVTEKAVVDFFQSHTPPALGVGQNYQDVTSQREFGVIYENKSGKPIFVTISGEPSYDGDFYVYVNDVNILKVDFDSGYLFSAGFVVPPNATYKVMLTLVGAKTNYYKFAVAFGNASYRVWAELR